jgi:hypothetical protein
VSIRKLREIHLATHPGARLRRARTGESLSAARSPLTGGDDSRAASEDDLLSLLDAEYDEENIH